MKKIFALIIIITLVYRCAAQQAPGRPQAKATNAVFYTETFDASMPPGWMTIAIQGSAHWVWYPNGQLAPGPNPNAAINTSTGFMILDAAASPSPTIVTLETGPIPCTGHPAVLLTFDQYFRRADDSCFVDVSTNSAFVNNTRFAVSPNNTLSNNAFLATNPYTTTIDISSIAGNQPFVYLRFYYSGQGNGYSWQIDNVQLSEPAANYITDSFKVYVHKDCSGPNLVATKSYYAAGMSIRTDFGDGHIDTSVIVSGNANGYASVYHIYAVPGTYNVKQVLYEGANAVDSLSFPYTHSLCSTMPLQFYYDGNGNCTYDSLLDYKAYLPVEIEVDSNNMPIDSISCTSSITYTAFGAAGDVYKFKVLSLQGDLASSCPVSGIIIDTFHQGINAAKYLGFVCQGNAGYDLGLLITNSQAGTHAFQSNIILQNQFCTPQNAAVTMNYDPSYLSFFSIPSPVSQSPGIATWNINGLSASFQQPKIYVHLDHGPHQTGDVIQTSYTIALTASDANPADNTVIIYDTVKGSFDPNAMYVKPSGCVPAGTNLEYTITFENVGNAPAENIYVLDTLPAGLEASSMKLKYASHNMDVEKIYESGLVIFRFSFPNIMLPDSSHHESCNGTLIYIIDTKNNLQIASTIDHRAGIYFDYNDPVITNTAQTGICWPVNTKIPSVKDRVSLYPNPANEELKIKTDAVYKSYTITNSIGQIVMKSLVSNKEISVDIKGLAQGVYYINLKGTLNTEVKKFVKM